MNQLWELLNYELTMKLLNYVFHFWIFLFPDKIEIPVFMELASISAGENDIDIDKVQFFCDAIAASAPIIFDLRPTPGFERFSAALSFISKTTAKDNNLPKKFMSLQIPCSKITCTCTRRMNCQCLVPFPRGVKISKWA